MKFKESWDDLRRSLFFEEKNKIENHAVKKKKEKLQIRISTRRENKIKIQKYIQVKI